MTARRGARRPAGEIDWEGLRARAEKTRRRAHAPYSKFHVGAALLGENGEVFEGANVENASYGLSLCAERSAVARAVAEGVTRFRAIAIVAGDDLPVPPCGMCRQVLAEFAPAMPVRSYTPSGHLLETTVAALLPHGFSPAFLAKGAVKAARDRARPPRARKTRKTRKTRKKK